MQQEVSFRAPTNDLVNITPKYNKHLPRLCHDCVRVCEVTSHRKNRGFARICGLKFPCVITFDSYTKEGRSRLEMECQILNTARHSSNKTRYPKGKALS